MNPLGSAGDPALRRVGQARIRAELLLGGFAFEPTPQAAAACDAALARWVRSGLPQGRTPDGGPGYNPAEVHNFMVWSARFRQDPFWPDHYVTTGRRLVAELAAQPSAGQAHMRFRRRFFLREAAPGRRLRLPVPLNLAPGALRPLGAWPAPPQPWPGRLECQLPAPCHGALELGWEASFPTGPLAESAPPDAAARALWTRPREGLVQVSPVVAALAQRLAAGVRDPFQQAMRLWRWVNDNLLMGCLAYDEIDAAAPMDWLLRHRWMDCQLGAALLVSLARALRLPARLVGGHLLYARAPCQHYWAELWLEPQGWLPFDLFSWGLANGGQDPAWRDHFAGRLEPRLTSQVLPRLMTGPFGAPLPPRWQVSTVAAPGGIRTTLADATTGAPCYEDTVSVSPASSNATPL